MTVDNGLICGLIAAFEPLTAQKKKRKKKKTSPKPNQAGNLSVFPSSQFPHITNNMKRKTEGRESLGGSGQPDSKRRALTSEEAAARFRDGLFEPSEQQKYTDQYAESAPYVDT